MEKRKLTPRRIIGIVLAAAILLSAVVYTAAAASADPVVMYNGSTGQIEFQNALPFGGHDKPDLFTNLKGLMPGDSVTQEIRIGAKNIGADRVRIHLRAENPNEDYQTLIETYGHWVGFTVKNGSTEITGSLADGVALGTFSRSGTTTVSVTLSIDIEADNHLQALVAEVDWVFTAEVLPGTVIPPILPTPDKEESDLPWLTNEHINYIIGFDDGDVHPDWSITRAEVATIFYRLLTEEARDLMWSTTSIYPDVKQDAWYYLAICTLTNGGLLEGYPDGNFYPNQPITRAELSTIISRFDTKFGKLEVTESFADAEGHWAEAYIEFAAARGYVIGYPDGSFRPDQPITRAETVTMVNRCLKRVVDEEGLVEGYITWPDNEPGTWYYHEILEAANYHDYTRSKRPVDGQSYFCENWKKLRDPIDWQKHEQEWVRVFSEKYAEK